MKSELSICVAAFALCGIMTMNSCKGSGESQSEAVEAQPAEVVDAQPNTYLTAIENYLTDSIGSHYGSGDVCIPSIVVIGVDSTQTDDMKVWGDYWVYRYTVVGDTLKMQSGGNHPGLMHVRKADLGYEVTAFDAVGDGSEFLPSARRIYGDKFRDFQAVQADQNTRERVRAAGIADYAQRNGLAVKYYQDADWPAQPLPSSN